MSDDILSTSPRRSFLGRLAAGTAALGLTAFLPVTACAAEKTVATASDSSSTPAEPSEWPGALKTKHKMAVDAFAVNSGFPLAFAYTFGLPYASVILLLSTGVTFRQPAAWRPCCEAWPRPR